MRKEYGRRPGRPKRPRRVRYRPKAYYFKPQGIPLRELNSTNISMDEVEAMRLRYVKKLDQEQSARKMNISQSTFQRLLASANEKVASAIINGDAIRIQK